MKTVQVNASMQYKVIIGPGLIAQCGTLIKETLDCARLCIVTDDTVNALYEAAVRDALTSAGFEVVSYVFAHGEASKCAATYLSLLDFLAEHHLTRSDAIVALGGGVVGDLAGFAAATYLRGIRFVQMPTTLLAAVDSSVGGKTAIDIRAGKNLVGAFWQPSLVLCDTETLRTLPQDVYRDGCAEIIKYGMICDRSLFERLAQKHVSEQEEEVIFRCVEIKRDVVAQDEFDHGMRALLNFGHTVGHAIEACSNFSISHGAGVAAGMKIITKAAEKMAFTEESCLADVRQVLDLYGFALECPYCAEQLYHAALSDKKRDSDNITVILPKRIGKCVMHTIKTTELFDWIRAGL